MPTIRVFLLTCRRPHLLPRALASLRAQTYTDWFCELHNDAPEDESPGRLLASVADPRFALHQHAQNLGPVATFNHAFRGGPEPFATILEDDNWWEPSFLARTLAALSSNSTANVAWANMRIWREEADGSWSDTARTIWPFSPADSLRRFHWPQPLQMTDAVHSNGAMLFRCPASAAATVPPTTPFAIIEPVRERLMGGDWLLLPEPLGNFALTRQSIRGTDRLLWTQSQLLVAASYLQAVPTPPAVLAGIWRQQRALRPLSTVLLFQLACAGVRPFALLRHANPADWMRFLAGALRRPVFLLRALRFRRAHAPLWLALSAAARARTADSPPDTNTEMLFSKWPV